MMNPKEQPVRIGRINYVNVLPFFHGLQHRLTGLPVEMVTGVPSALNGLLAQSKLDLAPVSSFAYARHANDWVMLPGLSVSAPAEVRSILLLHRKPVEQWKELTIALTTSSETSVQLLKLLLSSLQGVKITFVHAEPDVRLMMQAHDAALVIGDDALKVLLQPVEGLLITDLGQWWQQRYGHGMTYAVWAARKEFAERRAADLEEIRQALVANRLALVHDMQPLISASQTELGGTSAFWQHYFAGLTFDLRHSTRADLHFFYERCLAAGAIHSLPALPEADDYMEVQVGP